MPPEPISRRMRKSPSRSGDAPWVSFSEACGSVTSPIGAWTAAGWESCEGIRPLLLFRQPAPSFGIEEAMRTQPMIPQQGTLSPRNLEKPWPGRPCRSERQAVFGPVQPRVAIHAVQDIRRWSEGPARRALGRSRVGSFQATRAATAHLPMPRVPRSELRMRAEAAARPRTVFPLQSACTPAKVAGPSPKSRTLPGGIDAGICSARTTRAGPASFSRANSGRAAALLAAGSALPFYNEAALAQDIKAIASIPPDAIRLNANENPMGPCPAAMEAMRQVLPLGGRYPFGQTNVFIEALAAAEGLPASHVMPTRWLERPAAPCRPGVHLAPPAAGDGRPWLRGPGPCREVHGSEGPPGSAPQGLRARSQGDDPGGPGGRRHLRVQPEQPHGHA